MRLVVLGANGQLGMPVLKQLLQDYPQAQVLGCVRAESMADVKGDTLFSQHLLPFNPFTDDWAKLGRVDVLINCIGIIRETAELDFARAHIGLTKLMLQHREQLGNPRLIQLSALGAELLSPSRFLSTKAQADALLLHHHNVVVVRPSIVCTPNTMLSRKLQLLKKLCRLTFGVLPFPDRLLHTKLQPVMVEDLVKLISRLCQQDPRSVIVEVGGRTIYSLKQLLDLVPTCKKVIPIPQPMYKALLPVVKTLFPALLDKEQQVLLEQDNLADTKDSEGILGRKMADTVAFWRKELQEPI
jgi:nucleoside-diphosphate-sugar epimerase